MAFVTLEMAKLLLLIKSNSNSNPYCTDESTYQVLQEYKKESYLSVRREMVHIN